MCVCICICMCICICICMYTYTYMTRPLSSRTSFQSRAKMHQAEKDSCRTTLNCMQHPVQTCQHRNELMHAEHYDTATSHCTMLHNTHATLSHPASAGSTRTCCQPTRTGLHACVFPKVLSVQCATWSPAPGWKNTSVGTQHEFPVLYDIYVTPA